MYPSPQKPALDGAAASPEQVKDAGGRGRWTPLRGVSNLSAGCPAGQISKCPTLSELSAHGFFVRTLVPEVSINPAFLSLSRARLKALDRVSAFCPAPKPSSARTAFCQSAIRTTVPSLSM